MEGYWGPNGWQKRGFAKIQAVVLQLVQLLPDQGRFHVIWIDNLFTTVPLAAYLLERNIGTAGTVRTRPTKREEQDSQKAAKETSKNATKQAPKRALKRAPKQAPKQAPQPLLSSSSSRPKRDPKHSIKYTEALAVLRPELSITSDTSDTPDTPDESIPDVLQASEASQSIDSEDTPTGFCPLLLSVKNSHTKNTSFGDIYATVDKGVHQFAWRDGKAVVLFLSTVWDGKSTIQKKRKRPAHGTKKEQAPWDTGSIKELPIPTVIDDYNHHMNAVNLADQARATYNRHIREKRTWKPLFNFLLQTALSNAVKLWLDSREKSKKRS